MEQIVILPAREQVAEELRKAIFEKELSPGQELSQEKVAKELGISRMPVREAFQILEREGLISTKNRKTIVKGLSEEDIVDSIELRALLEGEAVYRACMRDEGLELILTAHEHANRSISNKDARDFSIANEEFHRAIWAASGSAKLEGLLSQLWAGLPPHIPVLLPEQKDNSIIEHEEIVNAIRNKDGEKARKAMQNHLQRRAKILRDHFNKKK